MNFPLVALLLLAVAAVNAVPSPSADDAFSIASGEITNLLQQGNDESACADLAKSLADEVTSSIDSKQKALDAVGVGAHCKDEGQEGVSSAKSDKEAKDKAAQDAAESCESAKNADVNFGSFSFSSISEGECGQFFQDPAYTGAQAAAKSACDAQVTADAEASAAATNVASAEQAAADARNKCRCKSKTDYNNAVAAANANTEDEQKAWAKAKHMACVLQGVGASDCKVDAMPEVVAKDLPDDVASAVCTASPTSSPTSSPTYPPNTLWNGGTIHLRNQYSSGSYLDTCGHATCGAGTKYGVSTSSSKNRDSGSGKWTIERANGHAPVQHGDVVHLKNHYGGGSYLDTCAHATCGAGTKYGVSTSSSKNRDSGTGKWTVERVQGNGYVQLGDMVYLKNHYGGGSYLDTCGHATCGTKYSVSTSSSKNRDSESGKWQIIQA